MCYELHIPPGKMSDEDKCKAKASVSEKERCSTKIELVKNKLLAYK